MDIKLLIDYREKSIIDYFSKNKTDNIEVKNLDIGDFIFKINDVETIIIERKTMCDLASSITDKRLKEQKYRILNSNFKLNNIIYIIEGKYGDVKYGSVNKKGLCGSIINSLFRDNIKVYRSESTSDTIYFLERMMDKLKKNDKNFTLNIINSTNTTNLTNTNNTNNTEYNTNQTEETYNGEKNEKIISNNVNSIDYLDGVLKAKKKNMTCEYYNQIILINIPGISTNLANHITKVYPKIIDLIKKYQSLEDLNEKKFLLANIEISIGNNKKRKLGKVLSNRIYEYIYNL